MSELAHQIRNYSNFTWLNGSFLLDWLIHNLDVCCWAKNAWPVYAQGQGGRQVRTTSDQLYDHYAVEYLFPDGTTMMAHGRHQNNTWGFFGSIVQGATGCAVIGEGQDDPRIFKGHEATLEILQGRRPRGDKQIWQYKGPGCDKYQAEHDLLFEAIREDKPYNEAERSAKAAMVGILGRMAIESGQGLTWDQALASNLELAPGLDHYTSESNPPIMPDSQGQYPIAMPGITKVL
jgi:hypothetical protein